MMRKPVHFTLDSGVVVVVEPIEGMRSASACWLVPVGSAREPEDRQGLSAIWSEAMMRGAGDLDSRAQADAFDAAGASRSVDVETFYLRLAATTTGDRLADLLPLLTAMVRSPRFAPEAIEAARELSLMELAALGDDPHSRAMLRLHEKHAPPPINRSGMGTVEGLRAITHEDVVDRWRELARPGGSIFAIAGAVEPERVREQLAQLLDGWEGESAAVTWSEPTTRGVHCVVEETNQSHIGVAHDAPPEASPDSSLERIALAALSGGMAGRLFTEVRERRSLCYAVSARYSADRDFGRVVAYVGATPDKAQQALDTLVSELTRINGEASSGGGISAEEFQRAVVGLRSRVVMGGESTGARASALAHDVHRLGRARTLAEALEPIERASLDDVNNYLARRRIGSMTIASIGPAALTAPGAMATLRA